MIDIILITCNRLPFLKEVIKSYEDRLKTPYRLIIIDNLSTDGETVEYLKKLKKEANYSVELTLNEVSINLSYALTQGFLLVKSDYFITSFNDIVIPESDPDVVEKLTQLLDKNREVGAICLRTASMRRKFPDNGDIFTEIGACPAYFRIQRKSDVGRIGGFGYGKWEDSKIVELMAKIGKQTAITSDIWAKDLGREKDRGYTPEYRRHSETLRDYQWIAQDNRVSNDTKLDPKTNKPV